MKAHQLDFRRKTPTICIIGAGLAGMCAGIQLKRKLGVTTFEIFDTNEDFGGTWCVNTYPGCSCDLAIHLYSFSFEPKSDWNATHATQPEIFEYYQSIGKKYDLYKHLHTKHAVKCLTWMEKVNQWKVTVLNMNSNEQTDWLFDIVMSATGNLRYPKIPQIFTDFKGPMMHSAQWDQNIDLNGKIVAVVGTGTSAVQIIPAIVGKVKKLVSYQRSPSWVLPRLYFKFSSGVKWTFKNIPGLRRACRWWLFHYGEMGYAVFKLDKLSSHLIRPVVKGVCNMHLRLKVKDPILREKLRPVDKLGCKRPCLNSDYFTALGQSNVEVIRDQIVEVTDDSIMTEDGREEKIEVLILATGFRNQEYFAPMKIIGRNSKDILQEWINDKPTHYKAMTSYELPNFFNILGPGADVGHNSLVFITECQVKWILQIIKEMMDRNATVFEVKSEIQENYMKNLKERMKTTIWATPSCHSIYSNSQGVVTIKHYDSLITHWRKLRRVNFRKFNFY